MGELHIVGANIVKKDGKILLVQEKLERVRGKWNLPAGRMVPGEDVFACAKREGLEETGLELAPQYLVGVYQYRPSGNNVVLFVFKSDIIGGTLKVPKDVLGVEWLSTDEIRALEEKGLLRSPYVWRAVQDYAAGRNMPLDCIRILD